MRCSVIVPTLNEVGNVDALITRLLALPGFAEQAEIVFVDDGSTDGTVETLVAWERRAPVRLVRRTGRPDLTRAIRDGVAAARHDAVVVMDADLSHAPEVVPALLAPLLAGTHDMVVGSRHVAGGGAAGWKWSRRLLSRLGALVAWPVSDLSDPTSGFFAARRALFGRLTPHAAGYKIALELAAAAGPGARIAEVPITFRDRAAGRSKLSLRTNLLFAARLAALAGSGLSARGLARTAVTALEEAAIDGIAVALIWALGGGLAGAGLAGFVAGLAAALLLAAREPATPGRPPPARLGYAMPVALLALAPRLLLLAWAGRTAGPAAVPIVAAAVAASALVGWIGRVLLIETRPGRLAAGESRWRVLALALAVYLFILRLLFMGLPQLSGNEAYYWAYAVHPSLSYLDHPPMVAWLIRLGTGLAGHTELGVRLAAPACWLVAALFLYGLTRVLFGKAAGIRAVLLLAIMPFFYAAGVHMTPDAPLVACWAAALYFLARLLVLGDRRAWLGLGLAFGLGLLSKYSIALLALAAFAFVLTDGTARRWLRRPEPYLALALSILLFTPVLVWNAEHGWASFLFQSARRLDHQGDTIGALAAWGLLAVLATPTVLAAIALSFLRPPARRAVSGDAAARSRRFLRLCLAVPLAVFFLVGLHSPLHPYWMGPPLLAGLPLAAELMADPALRRWRPARLLDRAWAPTAAIVALVFGFALPYASIGLAPLPSRAGATDWRAVAAAVDDVEQQVGRETGTAPVTVVMDSHALVSELGFYDPDGNFGDITNQQLFGLKGLMYAYWMSQAEASSGRPIILVGDDPAGMGGTRIEAYLDEPAKVQALPGGRLAQHRRLYYRTAHAFHTAVAMLPSAE